MNMMKTEDSDYIEASACEHGIQLKVSSVVFSVKIYLSLKECKELATLLRKATIEYNKNERDIMKG